MLSTDTKRCPACGDVKPRDAFARSSGRRDGLQVYCRQCVSRRNAESWRGGKSRVAAERYRARRREVLERYSAGDLKCACCGERHWEFLALDHTNGGGTQQRRALGGGFGALYRWLRENDWPDGFRVLCHNCNQARGFYGACPHQVTSSAHT